MERSYRKYPSKHLVRCVLYQGHQGDRGRVVLDLDRVLVDYSACSSTRWDSKYARNQADVSKLLFDRFVESDACLLAYGLVTTSLSFFEILSEKEPEDWLRCEYPKHQELRQPGQHSV